MTGKIKIILVDDHAVVRAGFRLLLSASEHIEVIAEAERGEQAIQLYQQLRPDLVVLDLSMPGIGGLETIRRIRLRDSGAKILVFSVHDEPIYVNRALNAGAQGYITKSSAPEIIVEAVMQIAERNTYVENGLIDTPATPDETTDSQAIIDAFSPREFDVFQLLAQGLTVHRIADELCLGYKTVANYSTQIKKKLQVATVAELAHVALSLGIMKR